jgi:hypothetical protein
MSDKDDPLPEVPDPDDIETILEEDDHVLDPEDLQYPEFVFDEGEISDRGGFNLHTKLSYGKMTEMLEDLSNGLTTHDIAVETPDGHVTFGVGPKDVRMQFDPDERFQGEFKITFTLNAKAMFVADDPTKTKAGARGGKGFIPLAMLTSDREIFRCYNWIDDPDDP